MPQMTAPCVQSDDFIRATIDLIDRARDDPAAFAPLYHQYFPRIYRYCLRRVSVAQEAEDLTSHIFTRALTHLREFRGGSFAAWLFRIAHNATANHLRDRRVILPLDVVEERAHGQDLLDRVIEAEEQARVARLIAALPDEPRNLIALRIAGELSTREIAEVTGKSGGAVRVALHRIVAQLRAACADEAAPLADRPELEPPESVRDESPERMR